MIKNDGSGFVTFIGIRPNHVSVHLIEGIQFGFEEGGTITDYTPGVRSDCSDSRKYAEEYISKRE